ncbi:hypothetical protein ACXR0O_21580 [Verrucomicrobiota bacterium sgz303538]
MTTPRFYHRRWVWLLAALLVALGITATLLYPRPEEESNSLNVPLGVEQAAIVTYSGPSITVAPYKWGVAVNVRIASVTEQAGARIYDVRYIVNRGGTFDLKNYLTAADGSQLEGLPSFKFQGDPKLSKELDARIQDTEEVGIDVGGHYYATLVALGVVWIVWLLLLIFYKRPRRSAEIALEPAEPTLAELLRAALAQLESGTLDTAGKARLEMLLLRRWSEELALTELPMGAALDAIGRNGKTAQPLRQLQHWLHHRASPMGREEIAAALEPFAVESRAPESADQP